MSHPEEEDGTVPRRLPVRWLVVLAALGLTACSLIVPGPDDFTYGAIDAGPVIDAGRDTGVDGAAPDGGCADMCGGECTDTRTDPLHCGSCALACSAPANGSATCIDAVCGFECDPGFARALGSCVEREAPRPIAPLSTSTVTSRRPTLRWELAPRSDGARVELCEDRACSSVLQTIDAPGTSARPPTDLPPGVVFWRLFSLAAGVPSATASPTWQMIVGVRSASEADTSWGTTLDLDGDGFTDLVVGARSAASGAGAAYVYAGGPTGLASTPTTIDAPASAEGFGGRWPAPAT